jgi:hypothetical protein
MADFYAMHVIEALRSGVPSRAVGACFTEARPGMMRKIESRMDAVRSSGRSDGMIFTGHYGEGKTHLLNTVFNIATQSNMAVSYVALGKETPISNLPVLYQKIIANTYLPGTAQPGFRQKLEELTPGSGVTGDLLAFSAKELETDKLYYLLRAMLGTQEEEEKARFLGDLEGDFVSNDVIKRSYRRVMGQVAKFNQNFVKTRHTDDYFCFMSHFFRRIGLDGWVILFDEAELIGRMGKKTRLKSYREMQTFLQPGERMEGVFSLFALSSSFAEDVIDKKHEQENAEVEYAEDSVALKSVKATLNAMISAPELAKLSREETLQILAGIQEFHGKAYDWHPQVSPETIYAETEAGGYLLRTKIRAAIEYFDQLYQYGEAGQTKITELGEESFEEDDTPEL